VEQDDGLDLAGGVALALLDLAAATGDERFQQAAVSAIEYERGLFCIEREGWLCATRWVWRRRAVAEEGAHDHRLGRRASHLV